MLYYYYIENKDNIHLKDMLDIVIKKYNNIKHSATKYKPNEIFFSHPENLFEKVLGNIKSSFTQIGKEFKNFNENDKCLLNANFK